MSVLLRLAQMVKQHGRPTRLYSFDFLLVFAADRLHSQVSAAPPGGQIQFR